MEKSTSTPTTNNSETFQRQIPNRPEPLQIPVIGMHDEIDYLVPGETIEWHGMLLPVHEVQSPITPSHWSVRIENPDIQHYYTLALATLAINRNHNARWADMSAVEFLPNLYLGSFYDLYTINHTVRVSILEDFTVAHSYSDKTDVGLGEKLEIQARDDSETNIMMHFDKVRDFLDSQPDDAVKIIHCVAGMNRSATLATAYYMYKTGKSLLHALLYMIALRPVILQNINFIKQLVVWAYDNGYAR